MKSNKEMVSEEIPEKPFFTLRELGDMGPFSSDYWSKQVASGAVKAIQRSTRVQGSRISIPRSEVIRFLSECVR